MQFLRLLVFVFPEIRHSLKFTGLMNFFCM